VLLLLLLVLLDAHTTLKPHGQEPLHTTPAGGGTRA
jgi:hypothetical protein